MIEHVHKHIIAELHQNTRTDIIFIITAIFLNLIALGINSAMAGNSRDEVDLFVVMFIIQVIAAIIQFKFYLLTKGKTSTNNSCKCYSHNRPVEGKTNPRQTNRRSRKDV